ncbi:MAG: FG-GAP-like repeat-containing protein [Gemmatimonadota bacterium]
MAALLAVLTTMGGCATSGAPGAETPGARAPGPEAFTREVAPFTVIGEDGTPYEHPFLGGYNLPRPQLVDIDGDGDLDLFVQEESGKVAFFEHVPDEEPQFQFRTDHFHGLDVGEWFRFVDLNRDGIPDLLAEQPFSYVRYYRNVGTATEPRFEVAADSLSDVSGTPIFSDRQNIPNATDIDCNGRMDLLIGRLTGTITRYQENGTDARGAPIFEHVTDRFEEIEIVAQFGSLHGANTMAFGDIDGDGDQDLFWGDFFEPGVLLLENSGTCQSPSYRGTPRPFPLGDPLLTSGYNAPTVGDVDGDGAPDLIVGVLGGAYNPNTTSIDNLHYLRQVGDGAFEHVTSRLVSMIDVGSESLPTLVDLDGDGDLDLLIGNKIDQDDTQNGSLTVYMNEGTTDAPRFRHTGTLEVGGGYHPAPAFGDLTSDGRLDVILGTWSDELRYLTRDDEEGLGLTVVDSVVARIPRGRNTTPTLGDLDGDGDLDMLVGESSGTLNFFENVGTPLRPEFELVTEDFANVNVGRRSVPLLHDLDGNGLLDLLVGSEGEGVHVYRNVGTRTAPEFVRDGSLEIPIHGLAAPALGDIDGDGVDDLFLGGIGGGLLFYRGGTGPRP